MSQLDPPVSERDHAQGGPSPLVTLVEYGDYECPDCGALYPVIRRVQAAFGDNLRFVYRHFPLRSSHPHAAAAAEAAEAAAAQGKFWEMHQRLFERQHELETSDLLRHAGQIGLDLARFERELTSRMHEARVLEDLASGVRSGVSGTPTLYINGERYDGAHERSRVIAALARAAVPARR